jgi:hypothetical protein
VVATRTVAATKTARHARTGAIGANTARSAAEIAATEAIVEAEAAEAAADGKQVTHHRVTESTEKTFLISSLCSL